MTKRRAVLSGLMSAPAAALLGSPAAHAEAVAGPPTVGPEDLSFQPALLRPGSPDEAGLTAEYVEQIAPAAAEFMEPGPDRPYPSHPGFVVLAARNGVVVTHEAAGHALRYESYDPKTGAVELPPEQWVPMRTDTMFDMASVTKLFTSLIATRFAEQAILDLNAPVSRYIPEFVATDPAKADITIMHLLRHVSGMVSWLPLYNQPDDEARLGAIFDRELKRPPGTGYEYSDLNLITLSTVLTRISGSPLDELVAHHITEPLGMSDTMFRPPSSMIDRIAATEYKAGKGVVRGVVHDENAAAFQATVGHAGIFSTAADIAILGQMILGGGSYGDARILSETWVRALLTNYNTELPDSAGRGLGWQIDQRFYMDAMTSPVTAGHTGFTGTCLVVDPISHSLLVLLTNRVHPTRDWGTDSVYRRAPARMLARAVPVTPATGRTSWYAGLENDSAASLAVPLSRAVEDGRATFELWYDTETTDICSVEASDDNGQTWRPCDLSLVTGDWEWTSPGSFSGFSGRRWIQASARLGDGATDLRFYYDTDATLHGRGIYTDKIKVYSGSKLVFNSQRPQDAARMIADGWSTSPN